MAESRTIIPSAAPRTSSASCSIPSRSSAPCSKPKSTAPTTIPCSIPPPATCCTAATSTADIPAWRWTCSKIGVANIADLIDRQMALLCNPHTNNGLPADLVARTGTRSGQPSRLQGHANFRLRPGGRGARSSPCPPAFSAAAPNRTIRTRSAWAPSPPATPCASSN